MKYDIKYVSNNGIVELSTHPLVYTGQDFFRKRHAYESTNLISGRGVKVKRFYRDAEEYTLSLGLLTTDRTEADERYQRMSAVFENDIEDRKPGKLYVNGSYLECYVISSETEDMSVAGVMFAIQLTILAEKPLWIREEPLNFETFTVEASSGFILPTAIPFGFTANPGIRQLSIDHYASVPAEISFFGQAVNPSFSIGSHIYQVNGTLLAGERFVINQLDKTVVKVTNSGEVINAFNLRSKTSSVFEPIPAGGNVLTYSGEFAISLILFYERGEPRWS